MYEDMDDMELLDLIWSETLNAEEFLAEINNVRPYLYEESKFYLRQIIQGVNYE